jgi:di/tricarboxylate transporter
MFSFNIGFTIFVILVLIIVLYKNWLRPSLIFVLSSISLIVAGVLEIEDLLTGLSNKQIIVIFLLIIVTAGIQKNIGNDFFFKLFRKDLSVFSFRLRMMVLVSSLSSLINNTPIVAFMIPYVKEWATQQKLPASKFLIPLSFATILGGMVTVVGTSTNLVLNGLIEQAGLPLLNYTDFLYLGLLVTFIGVLYLAFFSDLFLPGLEEKKQHIIEHLNEYVVETIVKPGAPIIGKTVEAAGLRHLKEIFLVEIRRENQIIAAVGPDEKICTGDVLFFAGNTKGIFSLMLENKGLELPEESHVRNNSFFKLTEAVVPSGSSLIGSSLKDCNFRNKYKGSVISIYRKGEKVIGNLGEIRIQAGDLFLMLTGKDWRAYINNRDLVIVTLMGDIAGSESKWGIIPSIGAIAILLSGVFGYMDLFMAATLGILFLLLFKMLNLEIIKKSVDIDLLAILICSLAIGTALTRSGAADAIVSSLMVGYDKDAPLIMIILLFVITLTLTSLITNAAAVSIMFPIALSMGAQFGNNITPFFVTIAFAASASFLTPIGYQTNLMVMGPGNYRFRDFFRIGFPLTILYAATCIIFIYKFYPF